MEPKLKENWLGELKKEKEHLEQELKALKESEVRINGRIRVLTAMRDNQECLITQQPGLGQVHEMLKREAEKELKEMGGTKGQTDSLIETKQKRLGFVEVLASWINEKE